MNFAVTIEILEAIKSYTENATITITSEWKDGAIDLSSFAFRTALLQLNQDNSDTEIILQGWDCYNTKKLSVTMPHKINRFIGILH